MATLEAIAIRRAEAERRIATTAAAIGGALGVGEPAIETAHPMSPFPAELGAALYAEGIATYLETVALAVAPAQDLKFPALTRAELDERAASFGVENPAAYRTKSALIAAIDVHAQGHKETTVSDETPPTNPTRHVDAEGEMEPLNKPAAHAPDSGSIADAGGPFGATTLGDVGEAPATGNEAPSPKDLIPEARKDGA